MSQSAISRMSVYASLSVALALGACQEDQPASAPAESSQQALVAAPDSASANSQQAEATSPNGSKANPGLSVSDLAQPSKVASYPPQNTPLIRYQSPFETGKYNVTKQKGGKAFVASPPPATAAQLDGTEQRHRVDQYLAQWEQQKGQVSSLSAEAQEVARGQLKRRVLGE